MYKMNILLVLVMLFSIPVFAKVQPAESKMKEGGKAHPFTLVTVKRKYKSLRKIRKANENKKIFLIFFTTSCKYCGKERTKIIEMAKKYTDITPFFIAVRNPKDESISEFSANVKKIIKDEKINYDIGLDLYSAVAKFYNVKEGTSISVPKLFIIDANNSKIIKVISGYEEKLEEIYKKLNKKN